MNISYGTNQYTFSSLTSSSAYYFRVYSYNGDGTSRNYKTDGTIPSVNATTLSGSQITALAEWDFSTQSNFGTSPLSTSSQNANVTVGGLTRGSGFGSLSGTAAGSAWGATNFTSSGTLNGEIAANKFFTFSITSNTNYNLSLTDIAAHNIRRSGTGPSTGQWQYKVGSGSYINIGSAISFSVTTSAGNPQSAIDLSGITDLQNVFAGTVVTIRLVLYGASSSTGTGYLIDLGNSATSDFIINGRVENTLPVNLLSFVSSVNKNKVCLGFSTSSEMNNFGFDVERQQSPDVKIQGWEKAGFVKGNGTVNTLSTYNFEDKNLQTGNYRYRLKQIDYNGNYEYHYLNNDVEIFAPKKFSVSQNYPNPFNPVTKIGYEIPVNSLVKIILYDVLGRELKTLVNEYIKPGTYEVMFDGTDYPSGIYFYRLSTGGFSETKRMLIVK